MCAHGACAYMGWRARAGNAVGAVFQQMGRNAFGTGLYEARAGWAPAPPQPPPTPPPPPRARTHTPCPPYSLSLSPCCLPAPCCAGAHQRCHRVPCGGGAARGAAAPDRGAHGAGAPERAHLQHQVPGEEEEPRTPPHGAEVEAVEGRREAAGCTVWLVGWVCSPSPPPRKTTTRVGVGGWDRGK